MNNKKENVLFRAMGMASSATAGKQRKHSLSDLDRAYFSEADEEGEEGVEAEIHFSDDHDELRVVDSGLHHHHGEDEDDVEDNHNHKSHSDEDDDDDVYLDEDSVIPNPISEAVDLSQLRGVGNSAEHKQLQQTQQQQLLDNCSDHELEGLAELVPGVKSRQLNNLDEVVAATAATCPKITVGGQMTTDNLEMPDQMTTTTPNNPPLSSSRGKPPLAATSGGGGDSPDAARRPFAPSRAGLTRVDSAKSRNSNHKEIVEDVLRRQAPTPVTPPPMGDKYISDDDASSRPSGGSMEEYPDSDSGGGQQFGRPAASENKKKITSQFHNRHQHISSSRSISTATQTHEVRMPMYLPTFKPATGCTNASDFIVRCFVARLRGGITVVKHGRSRFCKSRLRIIHVHPDGRSLSWKPAEGEPASSRRAPKLDLSTCLEVRHAWSPDPQNPMYTGTPILRLKCEAVNAHKSFALIFKSRTVDITAVTADQCKVLMEGFSALCFRLQVANLASSRGGGVGGKKGGAHGHQHARPMPEEDGASTTASNTNTNTSTPRGAR